MNVRNVPGQRLNLLSDSKLRASGLDTNYGSLSVFTNTGNTFKMDPRFGLYFIDEATSRQASRDEQHFLSASRHSLTARDRWDWQWKRSEYKHYARRYGNSAGDFDVELFGSDNNRLAPEGCSGETLAHDHGQAVSESNVKL